MRLDQTFRSYFMMIIAQGYALKWPKEKIVNRKEQKKVKEKMSTRQIANREGKQRKIKCRSYKMPKIF